MTNLQDTPTMEHFIEHRNLPNSPSATFAADISRHLQVRQYLGAALVICDNPTSILSAVRKQWLKAARRLQKLRASTLNAEEILRLTHAIMHMHNVQFTSKSPLDCPDAAVYFTTPAQLTPPPNLCYTVYVLSNMTPAAFSSLSRKLPEDALVVNYTSKQLTHGFAPKTVLEQRVLAEWQALVTFLHKYHIYPEELVMGNTLQFGAMDTALDTLLNVGDTFLRKAAIFQRAINLAQPLQEITSEQQKTFEAVTRLAHRVQALTPGTFNHFLVNIFNDRSMDEFFLRDVGSELYADLERAASSAFAP